MLCVDCRDELTPPRTISPEQIATHGIDPTPAALVDVWGRLHWLDPRTTIGRRRQVLTILEPSISRCHAEATIERDAWSLRDLDSANGTFVDDRRITRPALLLDNARIRFGHIAFYFLTEATSFPAPRPRRAISATIRAPTDPGASSTTLEIAAESRPVVMLRVHESTGGGGVIEVDGKSVWLTIAQLELVARLVERMIADVDADDDVRGFVPASELMRLSLDSTEPGFDHVQQLVRRVRKALVKAEIGDIIESRHGLGYRLRLMPHLERFEEET